MNKTKLVTSSIAMYCLVISSGIMIGGFMANPPQYGYLKVLFGLGILLNIVALIAFNNVRKQEK